ncbi:polyprenyl synthetase family protein [Sediminispirochaeta bajacaliforniensis]|uniref:polyprenyl synthetase family protein n=1 Tax=Sediminispirochaeta bajacaliforniensis TaxID=148 RepID=UPI000374E985|nr:polyprenyl synthetase family protein [Sediminispirochaeta bajacaliforniensis]
MQQYLSQQKQNLTEEIRRACRREAAAMEQKNPQASDLFTLLADFSTRGKMIRGSLVSLGAGLVAGDAPPAALPLGAAMELFQSALLIHDDIMDRDTMRRGQSTVHHYYALEAAKYGTDDAARLGESLGICAGDVAIFLAFSLVNEAGRIAGNRHELVGLFSREMSIVGTAQMSDVAWSDGWGDPNLAEVISLYRYKTGRYTFSLPLSAGALIAGADRRFRDLLEAYGELLGILFQIRDDELGLFGESEEVGKPIGSDIAEGKKTLFYLMLKKAAEGEALSVLERIYGKGTAGIDEVRQIRKIAVSTGVLSSVETMMDDYKRKAEAVLDQILSLGIGREPWSGYLRQLLDYVCRRNS